MSCFPKLNQEFKITSKDFWNERSNLMENRGIFKIVNCFSLSCVQLYERLPEGESPSAEKVMDSFSSWYSKDETEEVFGEDTEYDEYRKVQSNSHTHDIYPVYFI